MLPGDLSVLDENKKGGVNTLFFAPSKECVLLPDKVLKHQFPPVVSYAQSIMHVKTVDPNGLIDSLYTLHPDHQDPSSSSLNCVSSYSQLLPVNPAMPDS